MTSMLRLRVAWSGSAVVGGGVSTFFFDNAGTASAITPAMNTFFNALKGYVPSANTWSIPNGGDVIESDDGQLSGAWTSGGAYTINGTGSGAFPAGVGGRINWQTSTVVGRRRLRGSTFIAPIINLYYENNGTLDNTMVTAINTASAALLATSGVELGIWHRPHPKGATNGDFAHVTSGTMPDSVSWLRTRRT